MRSGDQNWVSVSRAIRAFGESNRPPDWFSQKNCALQYSDLLEKVETPKRKRGERGEIETPGECIIRKLTIERIEELKKIIQEERESYKKLQNELDTIASGQLDDKLHELWEEILEKQREKEKRAAEHNKWLQEREAVKQAVLAQTKTKALKQNKAPQQVPNLRRSSSHSEPGSEPESFVDSPLNETQGQTEDDSATSESLPPEPSTSTPKPAATSSIPAVPSSTSPLLTSLLKSPTTTTPIPQFSILHSAFTQSKEVPASPVTTTPSTSAITTLLNSSPSKSGVIPPVNNEGEIEQINKPSTVSPSAGAPTLSRLLEMPLASPGKPLPPLPVVSTEGESSLIQVEGSIETEIAEDVTVESSPNEIVQTSSTDTKDDQMSVEIELSIAESEAVSTSAEIEERILGDSDEILDKDIQDCVNNLMTKIESQDFFMVEVTLVAHETPSVEQEMEISPAEEATDGEIELIENKVSDVAQKDDDSTLAAAEEPIANTTEIKEEVIQEEIVIQETVMLSEGEVTIEVPYEEETVEVEGVTPSTTNSNLSEEGAVTAAPAASESKSVSDSVKEPEPAPPPKAKRLGRPARRSVNQGSSQKIGDKENENEESKVEKTETVEVEKAVPVSKEKEDKQREENNEESKKQEEKTKPKTLTKDKANNKKDDERGKHHRKKESKEERKEKKEEKKEVNEEKMEVKEEKKKEVREEKKKEVREENKKEVKEEKDQINKKEEMKEKKVETKKRKFSKEEIPKEKKKEEVTEKIKPKSDDAPSKDSAKSVRKGKEKDSSVSVFIDTDDDKMSEKEDYSVVSRHFPMDSIPNSPASNTLSDDQESLREYKVWKKAIMLVWRSAANHKFANVFLHPVTEEVAPGYHSVVIRPMDLSQIKKNIENGLIKTTGEFQRDMMLMFQNAIMYNSSDHDVFHMAVEMQKEVMHHIQDFLATQLMVQTAEISKSLRRETRELTHKRSSETQSEKTTEEGKKGSQEAEGNKSKKRRIARANDD